MFTSLKGSVLWATTAIVLGILAAVTILAYHGTLGGDLWVAIVTPLITGLTGVTAAHVTGNQVASALQTPPPVTGPPVTSVGTPGAGPAVPVP